MMKLKQKIKFMPFMPKKISLYLSLFYWADFRKTKTGFKLHTQFEISTQMLVFIHFSNAIIHDVNDMDISFIKKYILCF